MSEITGRQDLNQKCIPMLAEPSQENLNMVKALLEKEDIDKEYIALCVKAEFELKNWLPERWSELIKSIDRKYNIKIIITGVEKDQEYAQRIIDMSGVAVVNLCGKTSMIDLMAIYKLCKLFITTELGAAHLAAAINTPIVGVYCASSMEKVRILSDNQAVGSVVLGCRPCELQFCENRLCANNLTVEMIMEKVDEVWSKI